MKHYLRISLVLMWIALMGVPVEAQKDGKRRLKKWTSESGYWVIESNIHSPKTNTFYCYNNEDSLIYSEKIIGVKINTKKRATLKKLKTLLDNSLIACDRKENVDGSLVKTSLKIKSN